MLVAVNNAEVTLKKIALMVLLCTWFDTMDMKFLVKVAANRLNPLVVINDKENKRKGKKQKQNSTTFCTYWRQ